MSILRLGCRILPNDALDPLLVFYFIPLEEVVRLGLRGRLGVGIVEQILYAQKDLLDGNGRFPGLVFVEDRKADGAGGVDIRMEQRRNEFT